MLRRAGRTAAGALLSPCWMTLACLRLVPWWFLAVVALAVICLSDSERSSHGPGQPRSCTPGAARPAAWPGGTAHTEAAATSSAHRSSRVKRRHPPSDPAQRVGISIEYAYSRRSKRAIPPPPEPSSGQTRRSGQVTGRAASHARYLRANFPGFLRHLQSPLRKLPQHRPVLDCIVAAP